MRPRFIRLAIASWTVALNVLALDAFFLSGPQAAEAPNSLKRMRCFACHVGASQHILDGRPRQSSNSTIDLAKFRDADHGKLECSECHAKGFDIFPHRAARTETCMSCHPRKEEGAADDKPYEFDRMREEFEGTVHFTEYRHAKEKCCGTGASSPVAPPAPGEGEGSDEKKANERFTCEHCHEPHYFKATRRIGEPHLIRANDNGPCLHCHMDGATVTLADPARPNLLEAHAYLPYAKLHLDGTRCIDCHASVTKAVTHDLPKGKGADQGCNTCHSIDSVLIRRLYRYADTSRTKLGFHNAAILEDGYVMGANRHRWTDVAAYILMTFSLALVLTHGGWRILARLKRSAAAAPGRREASR